MTGRVTPAPATGDQAACSTRRSPVAGAAATGSPALAAAARSAGPPRGTAGRAGAVRAGGGRLPPAARPLPAPAACGLFALPAFPAGWPELLLAAGLPAALPAEVVGLARTTWPLL